MRNPLSRPEHITLASNLRTARDYITAVIYRLPKSHKATRLALKAEKALLELRSALDDLSVKDLGDAWINYFAPPQPE